MTEHPIEGLMLTAMSSIRDMIDVNTIIGEPIETKNNTTIIPVSKVGFGFAAGGSEFKGETIDEYTKRDKEEQIQYKLPFGGGSGAGVNISPIAFIIIHEDNIKLLPVEHSCTIDRILDYIPDILEKGENLLNKYLNKDEDIKNENIKNETVYKVQPKINKLRKYDTENITNKDGDILN